MTDQRYMEIIKALALGEAPSTIAESESVRVEEVEAIATQDADKVAQRKAQIKEASAL